MNTLTIAFLVVCATAAYASALPAAEPEPLAAAAAPEVELLQGEESRYGHGGGGHYGGGHRGGGGHYGGGHHGGGHHGGGHYGK